MQFQSCGHSAASTKRALIEKFEQCFAAVQVGSIWPAETGIKKRRSEIALRDREETLTEAKTLRRRCLRQAYAAPELASIAIDRSSCRNANAVPDLRRSAIALKTLKKTENALCREVSRLL
ncbi:hypothetical protein CN085_11635 [Sinorhizobium meliloti]|nr:hypothetical protein CN240_12835 [Sinorhizobium meliloti]RVG41413.1 hypothetical protein CN227_28880 [Sinorhizobium meliloti]RVP15057.1 hypothetical protein CN085_11635 [Sinorhizobium meliloti]